MNISIRGFSLLVLVPIAFYDVLTSFVGGFALFSVSPDKATTGLASALLFGMPFVLALGAAVLNYWTIPVWKHARHSLVLLRFPWVLFLLYDAYTTFLGISGVIAGSAPLSFHYKSVAQAAAELTMEQLGAAIVVSLLIVVTPMMCNFVAHYDTRG